MKFWDLFLDILQKALSFTYLLNFFWTVVANITLIFLSGHLLGDDKDCVSGSRMDSGLAMAMALVGLVACLCHILALNKYDHYGICSKDRPFLTKRLKLCGSPEDDYMHASLSLFSPCDLVKLCIDLTLDILHYVMAFFAYIVKTASGGCLDCTINRDEARAGDRYLYRLNPCKSGAVEGVFDKKSTARDIFGMTMFLSLWAYLPAILLRGDGLGDAIFALESEASSASYSDCSSALDATLVVNDGFIVGFFFLIILNILSVIYAHSGEEMNKAVVFGVGGEGKFGDPRTPSKREGFNFDHGEYGMGNRGMA